MAEIIISPKKTSQNNNNYSINFDYINKNSVLLELSIIGVPKKSFVYWEIFSNGSQVDLNDLTTGHKVELKILKSYSGPKSNPHIFTIIAKNKEKQEIARKDIEVFASPKVEKAYWSNSHSEIEKAFINSDICVHIEGKGLYQYPIILTIYDEKGKYLFHEEIKVDHLEQYIISLDTFYEVGFIRSILSTIIQDKIDKIFFTLTNKHGKMLYKSDYLYITINMAEKRDEEKSINPVVLYDEKYFTQRYEPCKYESISYAYGKEGDTLFNHGEPTKKKKNNYNINIITGNDPKGQKLEITLGGVDTRECEYNDKNRIYTAYSSIDNKEIEEQKYKDHKGNIFDKQVLLDNGIINEENKENILKFVPKYPYPKDDWEFLKQSLFGEAISKTIAINTCRYKKKITLKVFPDVLWTFHSKFGYKGDYFYDENLVEKRDTFLVNGIDNLQNLAKKYIDVFSHTFSWIKEVDNVVDFIAEEAKSVSFGLHAWYNNKKNKIDYTRNYQKTTEFFIFSIIVMQLALEVLFIVLTRGRSATRHLKKVQKTLKKVESFQKNLENYNLQIIYPAVAMNSASYYEKQNDGRMAQIVEFNIKAAPLIGINYTDTFTLEQLIKNQKSLGNKGIEPLAKVIDAADLQAAITISIDGTLSQEYKLKINTLTNEQHITPIIGNYLTKNKTTFTQQNAISIFVDANANGIVEFKKIKSELKSKVNANGSVSHSRSYGKDKEGIWIQDIITLSDVKGTYMVRVVAKYKNEKIFDTNPEEKPTPFTAFEGKEIKLPKVYLLKL